MKEINVKIEGVTPLLMNRFQITQISDKSKKRSGEQKDMPIEEKLYLLNGKPYVPARYFEACITDAGKQFKITGKSKATYSKLIGATVNIEPEAIMLTPNKYESFIISAVNPMTKGRMVVNRPMFRKWGCEFSIVLQDDNVSIETIQRIVEHAGNYVGIGDWRPDKKGKFGKFRIVEFKEAK